jgi:ketosteroid isomerase-like protein
MSAVPRVRRSTAEVVSDLYDAFVTGDVDAAVRHVAPDFIGHVPGNGLNGGEYWGPAGFRQFMTNIARYNGGTFEIEVPVFSVAGDDAFTREIIRINRAQDPERIWTLRFVNWFKTRDGKIAEHWVIPEDQHVYDEYWAGPFVNAAPPAHGGREAPPRRLLDVEHATSDATRNLLAGMYERFWRGDADGMRALISDAVVVNIVGRSAMSGVYEGWEGYMQFRAKLMAMAGDKYRLDVIALAASDRDAWATEYIRMNRRWDPAVHELRVQMHFEIDDGKIVRMDDFPLDTYAWERFYTPPRA